MAGNQWRILCGDRCSPTVLYVRRDATAGRSRSGLEARFLINVSRFAASRRRIGGDTAAALEPLGAYFRSTSAESPGIGDVTADN